uniref:G-protein coupled receptors family 1 profile domain-containing protein n=1 Tax=Chelydra serpentina TaxID=8475 RepID=A0A8C3XV57_CHESE
MDKLFFWCTFLSSTAALQVASTDPGAAPTCPPQCHCEEDGIMLSVDCSELGLSQVPVSLTCVSGAPRASFPSPPALERAALWLEALHLQAGGVREASSVLVFLSLFFSPYRMLQNNQLSRIPAEALRDLPNLQSLRLDANLISVVPKKSFEGLPSLRHLWLDDNALTEIPVQALSNLPALQAMTLALNLIWHIPDYAFQNLSSLVMIAMVPSGLGIYNSAHPFCVSNPLSVLRWFPFSSSDPVTSWPFSSNRGFHNNNIKAIPEKAFVGNPLLQTIHFYDNPIQFVGQSAFQVHGSSQLPTQLLPRPGSSFWPGRGAGSQGEEEGQGVGPVAKRGGPWPLAPPPFWHPCRNGTPLMIAVSFHSSPNWHWPPVSAQQHFLPSPFQYHILDIHQVKMIMGHLESCPQNPNPAAPPSFHYNRDLTDNQLVTLPLDGLGGLTHLKLQGNPALSEPAFPLPRILEVPYAYQCCAYGVCSNFFKVSSQWETEDRSPEDEDAHRRSMGLFPDDLDMDDFQLEFEESKLHPTIQCTPSPGPFKPCNQLFESWLIRLGVWAIALVSVLCNGLVSLAVFASPSYLSPVKFVIGSIAGANMLTGVYCSMLAVVDALTYGQFARYGARWETGAGCRATGFLSVFASEAAILLLTLATVQCSVSVSCFRLYGKSPSFSGVKAATLGCLMLSCAAAALPLFSVGEYGASPLCLPSPVPDGKSSTLGFMVALVMVNTLCFLIITGTYIRLYCNLLKGEFDTLWDCAMIKHVAWLIFTNCLLYCPVAFLTFSSMLNLFLITPEVIKSVLLVVLPLPACLNPLLYLLFNPHFRDDLRLLRHRGQTKGSCPQSYASDDMEKSSYDSTQALVTFSDADHIFEAPDALGVHPVLDGYSFPSVTLVPCQQRMGARGQESGFSAHHPCLTDDELLISSESRDPASSGLRVSFFPSPPAPSFTSHL